MRLCRQQRNDRHTRLPDRTHSPCPSAPRQLEDAFNRRPSDWPCQPPASIATAKRLDGQNHCQELPDPWSKELVTTPYHTCHTRDKMMTARVLYFSLRALSRSRYVLYRDAVVREPCSFAKPKGCQKWSSSTHMVKSMLDGFVPALGCQKIDVVCFCSYNSSG